MQAIAFKEATTSRPVEAAHPLPVTLAPSGATPSSATLAHAVKTVAAAGTPEALGSGTCRAVIISPLRTNTGDVYLGASGTNDTQHVEPPVVLEGPDGKLIDLGTIYVDVTVNGEGVAIITLN